MMQSQKLSVIGTRPIRHDGVDKVIGRAQFASDMPFSDALECKILRSPFAHAKIKHIDISDASSLFGVHAVVTAADFPYQDAKVLATDKVLYKGHPIAAVAAVNSHVAQEAINLIKVDYESLSPVLDVREAVKTDSSILHMDLFTNSLGEKVKVPSNVAEHVRFELGDVETAFAEADFVIEREFSTATVHPGYIEPDSATAIWQIDGEVRIWSNTRAAFVIRDSMSKILNLSVSKIHITTTEVGGAFGGKKEGWIEPVVAILSKKSGRPVSLTLSRDEVFQAAGPGPGTFLKCKMAANKKGKIVAAKAEMLYEAGAFPGAPIAGGMSCIFAAYDIENLLIDGFDVLVNKPKTCPYRAPGGLPAAFASESIVNELAEKLNMDPIQFRLQNAASEGSRRADGTINPVIGAQETLKVALSHSHYKSELKGSSVGRGVAIGFWKNGGNPSSCNLSINSDGTVSMVEGSADVCGNRAGLAMQAAEVLGIPAEDVIPKIGDTDSVGYTSQTGGSRVTFATGWAAYNAAEELISKLRIRAAKIWGINPKDVTYKLGEVISVSDPELSMTFKEIAAELNNSGGPISASANVMPSGVGGAYSVQICDVEVDKETGKVTILRWTVIQDVGRAVHPSYVEGQMQGGVVQGIGWALHEGYVYDEHGGMSNTTLLDYRMPVALDVPMMESVIVEVANPGHPFGVRGVGEAPIVPPAAAIGNAIKDALGIRMTELPMTSGKLYEAINSSDA